MIAVVFCSNNSSIDLTDIGRNSLIASVRDLDDYMNTSFCANLQEHLSIYHMFSSPKWCTPPQLSAV